MTAPGLCNKNKPQNKMRRGEVRCVTSAGFTAAVSFSATTKAKHPGASRSWHHSCRKHRDVPEGQVASLLTPDECDATKGKRPLETSCLSQRTWRRNKSAERFCSNSTVSAFVFRLSSLSFSLAQISQFNGGGRRRYREESGWEDS